MDISRAWNIVMEVRDVIFVAAKSFPFDLIFNSGDREEEEKAETSRSKARGVFGVQFVFMADET